MLYVSKIRNRIKYNNVYYTALNFSPIKSSSGLVVLDLEIKDTSNIKKNVRMSDCAGKDVYGLYVNITGDEGVFCASDLDALCTQRIEKIKATSGVEFNPLDYNIAGSSVKFNIMGTDFTFYCADNNTTFITYVDNCDLYQDGMIVDFGKAKASIYQLLANLNVNGAFKFDTINSSLIFVNQKTKEFKKVDVTLPPNFSKFVAKMRTVAD
jgi:hypothetical protein